MASSTKSKFVTEDYCNDAINSADPTELLGLVVAAKNKTTTTTLVIISL